MERARLVVLAPVLVVVLTLGDLAKGTVAFTAPSHPWWALTLFFAVGLAVLFLALETCPPNPVTRLNSSFPVYFGYILFGSFTSALARSAMLYRLDVDTVLEVLPVTVLSTSVLIVSINLLARLLRTQKS